MALSNRKMSDFYCFVEWRVPQNSIPPLSSIHFPFDDRVDDDFYRKKRIFFKDGDLFWCAHVPESNQNKTVKYVSGNSKVSLMIEMHQYVSFSVNSSSVKKQDSEVFGETRSPLTLFSMII
ncbi:hypothetical protein CEXT_439661 [Caerostris extrusa]|uniref:Uncharacterized protein n=1 Tax=Caerostris extrusa TaxID=172846 RepID=A0AAV4SHV4_CAEEX|nr:hypothetical protein CEXT_439661 [Caerostris extrusa]